MFIKVKLQWNVMIAAKNMDAKGLILKRAILVELLDAFASKKATKELGYYVAVTNLDKTGEGKIREHTGEVLFPVVFRGMPFKIFKGEIIHGVVHKVLNHGVFMRCGPIENVYLSYTKMPDYKYIPGENPIFMNNKMSRIQVETTVRILVIETKWM
ncbi:PREDICTED: DNA-directed RNA polymerase V subunit 7-like [Camelina sativa]|uniref:DNA-directed RNA polymerase subunit n=1 Tax=Camelina sativa TaxID=90675 RepID=A0ABM0UFD3_CAMSA|nr:PREDICTED: DNA-directed RNA polymerase V subunit 7-like [Camelina sativa]